MNQELMKSIWKKYVLTGEIDTEIRTEILNSWKRCRMMGVDAFSKTCPRSLSPEELNIRIQQNMNLLNIARPIAQDIYNFISESGFVVMICDKDGYILERLGDEEVMSFLDASHFWGGACCAEDIIGTNAVGTCLATGKPIQVYSYEHWSRNSHKGTCSASPIRDPQNNIIGVLNIVGPWEKVHPHTLGMIVASARAIENYLKLQANHKKALLAYHDKALILDSTDNGLITVDNNGYIAHINRLALKYLGLNQDPTGLHIDAVFKPDPRIREIYKDFLKCLESDQNISDEFISVYFPHGSFKCLGSAHSLLENNVKIGRLITIQDACRINKLVRKVASKNKIITFASLTSCNGFYLRNIEIAKKAAKTDANILILGESGTGKEWIAQAIHNASERENKPFIAINCGAISKDLLSSELFGYVNGAFTGAQKGGAQGKFEAADGGTLFLDEIGDMPLDMQAALLRVLQERVIMRVGGSKAIPVDVRIISATNKDLAKEVQLRKFRADLYYRLNVVCIELPALRHRQEDIKTLIYDFVNAISSKMRKKINVIEDRFLECCFRYDWPGNIRELRNIIERAIILSRDNRLSLDNFPSHLIQEDELSDNSHFDVAKENILKKSNIISERSIVSMHLKECQYNKSIVAKKLGISRTTLYRKLRQLKLDSST